jgi:thiamine biosynthesis protein ThiS
MEPPEIALFVNGEARRIAAPATVQDLLAQLQLRSEHAAVEVNRKLVRRSEHATTPLHDGDRIEVVTFFGGG